MDPDIPCDFQNQRHKEQCGNRHTGYRGVAASNHSDNAGGYCTKEESEKDDQQSPGERNRHLRQQPEQSHNQKNAQQDQPHI